MCKYCDNGKHRILSYDNTDAMNICCGQYQGVRTYADVTMHGNALFLDASGHYRSRSDCYYDSEGLDCDGEQAKDARPTVLEIKFCPFCGRNLQDCHTAELEQLNRDIADLQQKICQQQKLVDTSRLVFGLSLHNDKVTLTVCIDTVHRQCHTTLQAMSDELLQAVNNIHDWHAFTMALIQDKANNTLPNWLHLSSIYGGKYVYGSTIGYELPVDISYEQLAAYGFKLRTGYNKVLTAQQFEDMRKKVQKLHMTLQSLQRKLKSKQQKRKQLQTNSNN